MKEKKSEYIFIYSNNNEKSNIKIKIEYDKKIFQIFKFHLVNNTIPIVNLRILPEHVKKCFRNNLLDSFGNKGFQIFTLKNNSLIGVLEGPPETSFENGYFLFKILFPNDYNFSPPKFVFITEIFHPNISENGFVSVDILHDQWTPALSGLRTIIYSIQSLLDDP